MVTTRRTNVKTSLVKTYNGYSVYLESKDKLGGGGSETTSKPFKSFKDRTSALKCKSKLNRIPNSKKWAWLNLANKPSIKC